MNNSAKTEETPEPLSFASVLRDHLAWGVLLIDGGKKVSVLAGRARHLLGVDPDQASLPAFEALPAPIQAIIRDALASGKATADRQIEMDAGSRGRITLHISVVPLQPGRKDAGVVVLLSDLTAARQLEERLAQLDRLANMGTLAAAMAHEIKNALVAGKTFIDLLLEKHQDAELVGVVRREMSRIDGIVSRMLKFSGPARAAFTGVSLHEVLEHSLRLVEPQLEGQSIVVSRSFLAAPDLVQGDDYQLQQAFVNLFLNALEAMGANGTLSVATEICSPQARSAGRGDSVAGPHLRVTIKDTGAGIPPENMARLFEPFFTTKPKGTGLGLPITRRIILEHRGDISVESRPGQGATFQILLPVSA
ncbi:MAG: two-component system sensor histidine kinase NtrB [Limisphaerales bacterium]